MLKKKDKLPVVAFTFSKKKIDENAQNLHNLDLTTAKEKSEIHIFFHSSIKKLKGSDKQLPQVCFTQFKAGQGSSVRYASTWYADGRRFDPHVRQQYFMEIGHEIIHTAILSRWIKKGSCQLLVKECALSTGKMPRRLAQEQCG